MDIPRAQHAGVSGSCTLVCGASSGRPKYAASSGPDCVISCGQRDRKLGTFHQAASYLLRGTKVLEKVVPYDGMGCGRLPWSPP